MGSFFIRYMMQVAFIINALYLFDIPHFFVKSLRYLIYRFRHRHDTPRFRELHPFKDTWFFDLGYFQAYALTLFFLALLFAAAIPLITVFTFIFFVLRYWFDKYNQTFVYFKEFEAKGRLKRHIVNCLIAILIISQLLNYAFLKVLSGFNYALGFGIVVVCLEIGLLIGVKIRSYLNEQKL